MSMNELDVKQKIDGMFKEVQQHNPPERDSDFGTCSCCGKHVRYGNAVVEIERSVQQIDTNPSGNGLYVNVIDSDVLAIICFECGNKNYVPKRLRRQLSKLLELPPPQAVVVDYSNDIQQTPDPCDKCGCQIQPGNALVELGIMIAQVDWSEDYDNDLLTPIYAETLFQFCASCGNKMSTERLQTAIDEVLIRDAKSLADDTKTDEGHNDSDDYWDPDNYDDAEDDDEPAASPVLGYYSKQSIPGMDASFGDIPEAMQYVIDNVIAKGHNYFVDIRGGWEIEANEPSCIQIVPENKVFDNKKLALTIHIPFDQEDHYYTDELIRFMEFPLYKHFERYYYKGIPCFAFQCGTDIEKLNRIVRLLLVEVFRYTTSANIECNIFDQGPLKKTYSTSDAGADSVGTNQVSDVDTTVAAIITECDYCGANIHYGNTCVRFSRGIQQLLKPEPNGGFEKILIDEDVMGTVCASCSNMFQNLQEIRKQLGSFLELDEVRECPPPEGAVSPVRSTNDICNDCGKEIGLGNTELVIEKSVIQLPDRIAGAEKTLSGNELMTFCAWCAAGTHTRSFVREAVQEMIIEIGDTKSAYRKMREADPENRGNRGDDVAGAA